MLYLWYRSEQVSPVTEPTNSAGCSSKFREDQTRIIKKRGYMKIYAEEREEEANLIKEKIMKKMDKFIDEMGYIFCQELGGREERATILHKAIRGIENANIWLMNRGCDLWFFLDYISEKEKIELKDNLDKHLTRG